ncbi:MAG: PEP-CTERM sorting domain-containing protein [Terrimicrobiaceae bacterium]|nr:PEP-CTERM sorting domain-containing protein [Terrimicrobiaceae bacterium]
MSKISLSGAVTFLGLLITPLANAHIGYSGRNFGTLIIGNPQQTITGQTVSSSFGWADATDSDWGDSHRGRFYRFTLTSTTDVVISVQRSDLLSQTGLADTLLPGFSLFQGLGHLSPAPASHDSAALSVASRPLGTEGSLRTTADWSIGNDPVYNTPGNPASGIKEAATLVNFTYIGHAADGTSANFGSAPGLMGDGVADGFVTATFTNLAVGDYSIFVGGANYGAQSVETTSPFPTYGVSVSVQAIPEPTTVGLLAASALTFGFLRRRNRKVR